MEDVVIPSCAGTDVGFLTGSALPPGMIWKVPRKAKEVDLLRVRLGGMPSLSCTASLFEILWEQN